MPVSTPPRPLAALNTPDDLTPLVAACQTGDRAAFRMLFERFRHRVYTHARYVLGDDAAAKDASQAVFLRVWRALPAFDNRGDFSGWLYRVTLNTCITERQRRGRYIATELPETAIPAPQERLVLQQQIQRALDRLAQPFAEVLLLRHVEGLSYDEIAIILDCSIGTVGSRLSRAHEAIGLQLSEDGRL